MAVYAIFEHNDVITEHFVDFYPISKVVGLSFSAGNIMKSLEEYFQDQSVDLKENVRNFYETVIFLLMR